MLYLAIVSLVWALSFGLIKHYLAGVDASFVAAARMLLSLLVFAPFIRIKRVPRSSLLKLAGIGAVQFGLMYVFYLHAFAYLKSAEVAIFTIFTPLLVTLVDDLWERRMSWIFLATASLAVIGTGICLWTDLRREGLITGFIVMQLSNLCFAAGQVWYRRVMPSVARKDSQVMGVLYLGGFAAAAALAAAHFHPASLHLSTPQILVLLYLGVVASAVGFFLWNVGARRTNVGALAIFNNAKIPLGILASALIFQDTVPWLNVLAGGAIIAAALLLNQQLCRRRGV